MIQVYHNPRCTKSRACLAFLETSNVDYEVIRYLENPPTFDELKAIIQKLKMAPMELVRKKETIWIEQFKGKPLTDDEIIKAMVAHPILIERPIVINENQAVVARPLEKAATII